MALALVSCESFLDEKLEGEDTSETIFSDVDKADKALTGLYNSLSFTTNNNLIWVFGDIASDDAVKGGSAGDQADMVHIDNLDVRADNGILLTYWRFAYEGISRANNMIHGSYGSGIDDDARKQYIAQAKFVRAYYYFNLVNIWGKVPLRLSPNAPSNVNTPLSEVDAIYTQIGLDLRDAAELPVSYSTSSAGKITKGAALALLAKTYLYQGNKWGEVIKVIENEIKPLGIYGLEDNYADLFKLGAENSKEAVFAIRHLSGQNPVMGNSLNQWLAPSDENGYYFDAPTQSYVSCFNEQTIDGKEDPRLSVSIGMPGENWFDGKTFDAAWSPTGYLVKKHLQPLSEVASGRKGDGGLPYIYLRYADVELMLAEAYAQNNEVSKALIPLKEVRDRAGLPNLPNLNKDQALKAIYLERRRELGFEFHRFFDLMRWGEQIAKEALGANLQWQSPRYYFPIPQNELDTNK